MVSRQLFSLVLLVLTYSLNMAETADLATYEQTQAQMAAFMDALSKLSQQNAVRIDRVEATLKTVDELAKKCACSKDPSTSPPTTSPVDPKPDAKTPDWVKNLQDRLKEIESTVKSQDDETKKDLKKKDDALKDLNTQVKDLNNATKSITDLLDKHDKDIKRLENTTKNAFKEAEERAKNFTVSTNEKIGGLVNSTQQILNLLMNLDPNFKPPPTLPRAIDATEEPPKGPPTKKPTEYSTFINEKKNWFEAFADCRKKGLYLAAFENEAEHDEILKQIYAIDSNKKVGSFWVSATDLGEDDKYVWMSSGQNMNYSKWCKNQPDKHAHFNNETEHCAKIDPDCDAKYAMNDEVCSDKNYYVCEKRDNGPLKSAGDDMQKKTFTIGSKDKLNWYEALADCKAQGLSLATVESAEEQQQVVDLIKSAGEDVDYWLSGSDLGTKGEFVWMTTGKPLDYKAWGTNQPNHLNNDKGEVEHCLLVERPDFSWHDYSCSYKNKYICSNMP